MLFAINPFLYIQYNTWKANEPVGSVWVLATAYTPEQKQIWHTEEPEPK